jgi:hypothetical protein
LTTRRISDVCPIDQKYGLVCAGCDRKSIRHASETVNKIFKDFALYVRWHQCDVVSITISHSEVEESHLGFVGAASVRLFVTRVIPRREVSKVEGVQGL